MLENSHLFTYTPINMMFTLGVYLGIIYTHAYSVYNNRFWEPIDKWDIAFLIFAPITYPIMFLASLIKNEH